MNEWINASRSGFDIQGAITRWDADLTDGMLGGKIFDNVVYINNGDPPEKKTEKAFVIEGEMFYCGNDCLRCKCYDCKLEGF